MSPAGLPDGASARLHDAARFVGTHLFKPAYRLRIRGLERVPKTGPVLVVANHSSMVEPQIIFGMLPRRSVFLVKEEMFTGAVGWFLRRIGQVPVRRGEPDRAPLLTTANVLKGGGLVAVFPEGTRGEGDVTSAERGAAWLVRASGAVVLPIAVRGTRRPAGSGRRFRPRVDILVGEPFPLEVGRGRAGLDEATGRLRDELAGLVRTLDEWRAAQGEPVRGKKAEL
ncbi:MULTISPECIES: lysophospholipid acyltransferase family protein [Amycolatopsis]|uniref:1-acyl-sn-glycerol-3-phosphate acyltransferase n=1 Tax=Amycolatopsis thermoflava TaxID=84480 RepID=A0A3N2GNW6_9PSEU|nr:lysophospholipid acyltransferase family protein [Amycolatopsis thermoflava]ROS38090.1 1-acyl-sn-glycerol-3-phosphate acyltransferase [Amycolatopsis thermoflava]